MLRALGLALRHRGLLAGLAVVAAFVAGWWASRRREIEQARVDAARARTRASLRDWLETESRGEMRSEVQAARRKALDASEREMKARADLAAAEARRLRHEAEIARLSSPLDDLERAAGLRR